MSKAHNNTKLTLHKIQGTIFLDPKWDIANHASTMQWAGGFEFKVTNKDGTIDEDKTKELHDITEQAKFDKIVVTNEKLMSGQGYQINTLSLNKGGYLRIGQASDNYRSLVSRVELTDDISAVVWKKFQWDDISYDIEERWDRHRVKRRLYAEGDKTSIRGFNAKVPKDLQIKTIDRHNYGILPVFLFENKAEYVTRPDSLIELSDDYGVRNLPIAINEAYRQKLLEIKTDISQVFGNFSKTYIRKLKQAGTGIGEGLIARIYQNVKQRGEGQSKMVEIRTADLSQIANLDSSIAKDIKKYWSSCGYTFIDEDDGGGDTNAGALYSQAKDISTTKIKRALRQVQYAEFLKRIMVVKNIIGFDEWDNYNVVFQINQAVVQSPMQTIETEVKLVEAGLQPKHVALANIRDIDEESAKAIVEEATSEQDAEAEKLAETLGDPNEETSQMDPNDPKPQQE